ncbi:hypothetical protein Prudu_016842 [Prunus dulcis]|uniref:Ubiquitin-like protease family profile domain-containing protein n=1 Tax=Prunus dulcis TaxID=3755 RepID=A0A4Y1RNJ2_PRUDU|nr:hypothetical protein Prudu_016842 [Prunus dulcis]
MQFGNVEAEIEFFASLVKADGWLKGDVPPCGMDWQNVYKVYTPFMLTKYKHWVAVMIDLVLCEIKVYDSKVSLIPDDIVKEELARYQLRFQIFSTPSTFMKKVGDCGMFVLKYIELFSAQLPLATCTSHNMPFFRLKLAAEIQGEMLTSHDIG